MPPWRYPTVLSWADMRGVVSLAAALALPATFPGRDIIVFLAFCAIFATLVVQGTTLGWVIRRLGLEEEQDAPPEPETARARARARARAELAKAALDAVRDHVDEVASEHGEAAAELVEEYRVRAHRASVVGQDVETKTGQLEAQQRLRLVAIEAARSKLVEQTDRIDADAHRELGEELDLEEQQVRRALGEA